MLPTSTLFKNRLFIERNSKFKNIYSNLGLIFKNSKWKNFSKLNLNIYFTLFYKIFFAVILSLLFFFFSKFLINTIFFLFWTIAEALDYYISFLAWMIVATYSTITNAIYSYFFYNKFNKNTPDTSNFFFGKKLDPVPSLKKLLSSKINFSWETLTLLSQANNENFFNFLSAMADTEKPTTYFGFFAQSFYKLTFFMNLEIPKHSLPTIKSKISNLMIFQDSYFHEISFNTCCNVMPFWSNANINLFQNSFSLLNIYKKQFAPKQQKFLFWKNSNWNLSTTFLENNKYENDAILKSNIFYFSNFNLNLIKKFQLQHFFDFTNSLTKQLNFFMKSLVIEIFYFP